MRKYQPKPFIFTLIDEIVIDYIYKSLKKLKKIRIPRLGDFSIRRIKAREGWNPITKERMIMPAYNKIHFKADPSFSKYFNPKKSNGNNRPEKIS